MKDKIVNFFLNEEKKKELDMLAVREGRTLKAIFTELIEEYIKIHKEGNPQHLITSFQDNEDFMGFPSMAITLENKRKYLDKLDPRMINELFWHIQEWGTVINKK
jgi:hypothetical protein